METQITSQETSVPFVCSLSPSLRAALVLMPGDGIRRMVIGLVNEADANEELKTSLRQQVEAGHLVRQVDVRINPDDPPVFKAFLMWNWDKDCWHVCVEGGKETCFEGGEFNG